MPRLRLLGQRQPPCLRRLLHPPNPQRHPRDQAQSVTHLRHQQVIPRRRHLIPHRPCLILQRRNIHPRRRKPQPRQHRHRPPNLEQFKSTTSPAPPRKRTSFMKSTPRTPRYRSGVHVTSIHSRSNSPGRAKTPRLILARLQLEVTRTVTSRLLAGRLGPLPATISRR